MSLQIKIKNLLFNRVKRRISRRVKSGMSALLSDGRWQSGSFVTELKNETITVHVYPIEDGKQASVYAEQGRGKTGDDWTVEDTAINTGIQAATNAVYEVMYENYL